jgi:hypothetical protein
LSRAIEPRNWPVQLSRTIEPCNWAVVWFVRKMMGGAALMTDSHCWTARLDFTDFYSRRTVSLSVSLHYTYYYYIMLYCVCSIF